MTFKEQVEELAAQLHEIYEIALNNQGKVSRHPAHYANLSEDVKDLDRALACFILERESALRDTTPPLQGKKEGT